jgi:hypothetical protein
MGLRESIAHSLNSTHLEPSEFECAIDRIGALARTTALGSALWRYGYGGDESAARSVIKHLLRKAERRTKIYKHHDDFKLLKKTCVMVLHEWKYKGCMGCGGAGEISSEKLKVVCQPCGGTGLHRFSDQERMTALNIEREKYAAWQRNISDVWICLAGADGGTGAVCREQLEHKIAA